MRWNQNKNHNPNQKWNKNQPVVPFRQDGEGMRLGETWGQSEWYDVSPFTEALTIEGYYMSNGSCGFRLRGEDGFAYFVSMHDFFPLLQTKRIKDGVLEAMPWTFKKVGSAYLLTPLLV